MTTPLRHRSGLPPAAVASILQVLRGYPQIERVVLYGSRAMGNFRPGSDIDLCLVAPALGLRELLWELGVRGTSGAASQERAASAPADGAVAPDGKRARGGPRVQRVRVEG